MGWSFIEEEVKRISYTYPFILAEHTVLRVNEERIDIAYCINKLIVYKSSSTCEIVERWN
jgi:hypothetical protein